MIYKTLLGEDIDMDVEIWRPYITTDRWGNIRTEIEVSNWGHVRGKMWNGKLFTEDMIHKGGKRNERWMIEGRPIYRLVDLVFNGPKPDNELIDIHHLDGNPTNDMLNNLQRIPHNEHSILTNNEPELVKIRRDKWLNPDTNPNKIRSKETIENVAKQHLGTKHYNNGEVGILIKEGEEIPEGFVPGKLKTIL